MPPQQNSWGNEDRNCTENPTNLYGEALICQQHLEISKCSRPPTSDLLFLFVGKLLLPYAEILGKPLLSGFVIVSELFFFCLWFESTCVSMVNTPAIPEPITTPTTESQFI